MKFKLTFSYVFFLFITIFLQKIIFRLLAYPAHSWIINWLSFMLIFAIMGLIFENINKKKQFH